MKYRMGFVLTLFLSIQWAGMSQELETDRQKTSYAVGSSMGKFLQFGKEELDWDTFIRGLKDRMDDKESPLSQEETTRLFAGFQQIVKEKQTAAMGSEGKAWLEENAKRDGVITLPSGLQYKVIQNGSGKTPTTADEVKAHYRGTFIDGTEFDSSYERGEPSTFPVTRVIAGWTEALLLMKEGDKWELYIPYDLAYGPNGRQGIPPYSTLIFEIELAEVIATP